MELGKLESHMQMNELQFVPCTKSYSKWTKDINIRPETGNYIEENLGTKLWTLVVENIL